MEKPPRKIEIWNFITSFIGEKGYVPTIADIKKATGIKSGSTVWYHLEKLGLAKDWEKNKQIMANEHVCPTCRKKI